MGGEVFQHPGVEHRAQRLLQKPNQRNGNVEERSVVVRGKRGDQKSQEQGSGDDDDPKRAKTVAKVAEDIE